MQSDVTHYELCKKTAEHFIKKSKVAVFEYQSYATGEFPDVLCFNVHTWLFEIKVDKADFLKDKEKTARIKYRIKYYPTFRTNKINDILKQIDWRAHGMQEFIQEYPHLGRLRYYVCPAGLIMPEELPAGWGLYWFKNNKFYLKKESKSFRNNIYDEMAILSHAFRKYAGGKSKNILVNSYKE